ncbi:hypothetical protein AMTRI_Chr02g221360 [Amborella trichopoda]
MDILCFKTGVHGIISSNIGIVGGDICPSSSQITQGSLQVRASARNNNAPVNANGSISVEKPAPQIATPLPSSSSSFFTYPLRSLWPRSFRRDPPIQNIQQEVFAPLLVPEDDVLVEQEEGEREGQEDYGDQGFESSIRLSLGETSTEIKAEGEEKREKNGTEQTHLNVDSGNWVLKILHIRSIWKEKKKTEQDLSPDKAEEEEVLPSKDVMLWKEDLEERDGCSCSNVELAGCCVDEEVSCSSDANIQHDRDSFSKLLHRVSLVETKLYAQMSYLSNLAYSTSQIKPGHLLKYQGLRFVTSSIAKKEQAAKAGKDQQQTEIGVSESEKPKKPNEKRVISATAAYQVVAAAASYLHSQSKSILPFKSAKANAVNGADLSLVGDSKEGETHNLFEGGLDKDSVATNLPGSEVASFVATTNSVTAVVAAEDEARQAVAKDLNSIHSSPCEWFICDDEIEWTRLIVIQGSESLASWQANLLFEPIQFEGLDVLVHRGIYEAAKGIYEQVLPDVKAHLLAHGDSATFRFTGHSLGGSLSLVVSLMLLIRGEVPRSSLLPVVTFGSPCIMCGGDYLLQQLDLPQSHVRAVTMHRDIVPRAFSCNYPDHVAELLKAVNVNFRKHPCLKNQKLLYAPMGELLILQPDDIVSPHHHLLPLGSGLYVLSRPHPLDETQSSTSTASLKAAQKAFLNSPHPLETLSDRGAYGAEGTIYRDHDSNSYLKTVRSVIRQELKSLRKVEREQRRRAWWPLIAEGPSATPLGVRFSGSLGRNTKDRARAGLVGAVQSGGKSLRRFGRLIMSGHVAMLLVLLLPSHLLVFGASSLLR